MATTRFTSVDQYIAAQPGDARPVLEAVRSAIKRAVKGVEEGIAYQMPTFKLHGIAVLHLAGWKQHYSLYPATNGVIATFGDELEPYDVNDKGTIRFPLAKAVPVKLIERIAKFRAKEIAERAAPGSQTAPKKASTRKTGAAKAAKPIGKSKRLSSRATRSTLRRAR